MASTGTTLDLTLTQDFLNGDILNVGTGSAGQDVYAYAVLFENPTDANPSGFVSETTLVNDGTITASGTVAGNGTIIAGGSVANAVDYGIPLVANGDTLSGGKLYIVIESGSTVVTEGTVTTTLDQALQTQGFISSANAATYDFAYDSFEATLDGTPTDAANLTSVNGFALPMELSVDNNGTTSSVSYAVPGSTIVSDIQQGASLANAGTNVINTFTTAGLSGQFRMAVSPTGVNQPGTAPSTTDPYPQAGWATYVDAMETIAPDVTITGLFNGAPDAAGVWHNAGFYAYTLQWDGTDFWLVPTASSQIQGAIQLTASDIEQNIFSQVGSVSIYATANTDSALLDTVGVGDNTQWGAILAQFLTGFTGGYYGQQATVVTQGMTQTVDLNQNYNWNPADAFRQDTGTVVSSGTGYAYDPYSQVFYAHSNSYGSPYSDLLMSHYSAGGPLLNVADSSGTDAATLDLTVFGQNESPTGYTTPTIYDSIASAGTYAPVESNTSGANLTFSFYAAVGANAGIELDPDSKITIGFYDSIGWQTVTLDGSVVNDGTAVGLWHLWTISGTPGNWTAAANPGETAAGSLTLVLPTADSGVSLYQVTVGAGTVAAKTYNLYTTTAVAPAGSYINSESPTTAATSGVFYNPAYAGQASDQAIDGLATISGPSLGAAASPVSGPTQYTNTMTVNFTTGDTVTFNPSLVVENLGSSSNLSGSGGFPSILPSPPVAVESTLGTLSALAGAVITPGTYAATAAVAGTITSSDGQMQFGWAGYDTTAVEVKNSGGTVTGHGWTGSTAVQGTYTAGETITGVGGYTDKVNPYDTAVILVQNTVSGTTTITAPADVDGNWLSNAYQFGIGTYTLTMYDAVDNGGTLTPVTGLSDPMILQVTASGGGAADDAVVIACFAEGTGIATADGMVPVETLEIGDRVLTVEGRLEPIRWIGYRHVDCKRHPTPEAVLPVRISAHAFGIGLPARDLFLSPDHALYAEGVLVPVKHLVNGSSIRQQKVEAITYFHVELDHHGVVLAEGLPAETYLDTGDRPSFTNGAAMVALHPAWGSAARDISLIFEAHGYAPLRVTGAEIARLRARLAREASALPAA